MPRSSGVGGSSRERCTYQPSATGVAAGVATAAAERSENASPPPLLSPNRTRRVGADWRAAKAAGGSSCSLAAGGAGGQHTPAVESAVPGDPATSASVGGRGGRPWNTHFRAPLSPPLLLSPPKCSIPSYPIQLHRVGVTVGGGVRWWPLHREGEAGGGTTVRSAGARPRVPTRYAAAGGAGEKIKGVWQGGRQPFPNPPLARAPTTVQGGHVPWGRGVGAPLGRRFAAVRGLDAVRAPL